MKCAQVSSIVIEANHNGAVCLFRSSFETQQIYQDWFFLTLMVYHRRSSTFIKKCFGTVDIYQRLNLAKTRIKNVISNSVLIVEAKPIKSWITENIANFQIKLIRRLIYYNKFYKVWKVHVRTTKPRNFIRVWKLPISILLLSLKRLI